MIKYYIFLDETFSLIHYIYYHLKNPHNTIFLKKFILTDNLDKLINPIFQFDLPLLCYHITYQNK